MEKTFDPTIATAPAAAGSKGKFDSNADKAIDTRNADIEQLQLAVSTVGLKSELSLLTGTDEKIVVFPSNMYVREAFIDTKGMGGCEGEWKLCIYVPGEATPKTHFKPWNKAGILGWLSKRSWVFDAPASK
jgi:hypothetical protein